MGLTPSEAAAAYQVLSTIASDAGLEWLVKDVASEISLGKQSLKKIKTESTQHLSTDDYPPQRLGKPAVFVISSEYSESEKLKLLVEAIEAASLGTTFALAQVLNCLSTSDQQAPAQVVFAPDGESREMFSADKNIFEQKESAMLLQDLLKELKEAI